MVLCAHLSNANKNERKDSEHAKEDLSFKGEEYGEVFHCMPVFVFVGFC